MTTSPGETYGIRLQYLSKRDLTCLFGIMGAVMLAAMVAQASGPQMIVVQHPNNASIVAMDNRCSADPSGTPRRPRTPQCWNHRFQFHYTWTQYFSLDMMVLRNMSKPDEWISDRIPLQVTWMGSNTKRGNSFVDFEPIANASVTRQVRCAPRLQRCLPMVVFKTTSVQYKMFYFEVQWPAAEEITFAEAFSFDFSFRNYKFSIMQIWYKTAFLLLSVGVLAWFAFAMRKSVSGQHTFEQLWVQVLLALLVMFNNPLHALVYSSLRHLFESVALFFQFQFVSGLLLFWLVAFDGLRRQPPFDFKRFYLPKLLFVGTFWALGLALFLRVRFKEWHDPLFNWYEDMHYMFAVQAMVALFGVAYILWLVILLVQDTRSLSTMPSRSKMLYFLHVLTLVLCIAGLVAATATDDIMALFDQLFFHAAFNIYLFALAYMVSPSSGHVPLQEMTSVGLPHPDVDSAMDDREEFEVPDADAEFPHAQRARPDLSAV